MRRILLLLCGAGGLVFAAVAWAVSPKFSAGESGLQLLLPLLLPVLAGFTSSNEFFGLS